MSKKIFISYSSKNEKQCKKLCKYLDAKGNISWAAYKNIAPGKHYPAQIVKAIRACDVFILLFSKYTNYSEHVLNEINVAFNSEKQLFLFRLDQEELSDGILYYLGTSQWIDAGDDMDRALRELQTAIERGNSKTIKREAVKNNIAKANTAKSNVLKKKTAEDEKKKKQRRRVILAATAAACCCVLLNVYIKTGKTEKTISGLSAEAEFVGLKEGYETCVTIKSNNLSNIPIYENPGDAEAADTVPEAECVAVLAAQKEDSEEWSQIDYCDKIGWVLSSQLRSVSENSCYFYLSDNADKNVVFIDKESVKLHAEPDEGSACTATDVKYGKELTITKIKNGWGKTTYNGEESWVDMNVVSSYATKFYQIERGDGVKDGIKLRKHPSETAKVINIVPVGTVFQVTEFKNGWAKFTYNGDEGWLKLHYATSCGAEGLEYSEDK